MTSSKKPYSLPVLLRHGSLADVTGGTSGTKQSDKTSLPNGISDRTLKRDIRVVGGALRRLRRLGA